MALPLLLLSLAVFTVAFDRAAYWCRCWRRHSWRQQPLHQVNAEMAWGEPLLQAAVLLSPLLGLIGTTSGLMAVLRQLGPQLLLPPSAPLAGYAEVLLPTLLGLQLTLLALVLLLLNQGLRRWQVRRCNTLPPVHTQL